MLNSLHGSFSITCIKTLTCLLTLVAQYKPGLKSVEVSFIEIPIATIEINRNKRNYCSFIAHAVETQRTSLFYCKCMSTTFKISSSMNFKRELVYRIKCEVQDERLLLLPEVVKKQISWQEHFSINEKKS